MPNKKIIKFMNLKTLQLKTEKEFDFIVNKWKEPEWQHERHDTLIDYMVTTLKALRPLFLSSQTEAYELGRKDLEDELMPLLKSNSLKLKKVDRNLESLEEELKNDIMQLKAVKSSFTGG